MLEYSFRKLTNASDRLLALTGLVRRLRTDGVCNGRFFAGLWEDDLDFQLLWYTTAPDNTQIEF